MTILKLSDPLERIRTASTVTSELTPPIVMADLPLAWDTMIRQNFASTNYDTNTSIFVGESNATTNSIARTLIKIDWTSLPVGALLLSAELLLTPNNDLSGNARTMYAHRILRDVVSSQATYNIWKTSNNWGTAGCKDSTNDYDGANILGTGSIPASPTLDTQMTAITFDNLTELQKLFDGTYTDNGIVLFVDTEVNDLISYASTNHATPAYHPIVRVEYVVL
jgi:hypothetical protein